MNKFEETPQWNSGQSVADFLDRFFGSRGWQIRPTTPHEERILCLGDRHYDKHGKHLLIEYKSGLQTAATGNVFLETVSVDTFAKPGWVYTCKAHYIFYGALDNGIILIMVPDKLREEIEGLKAIFPEKYTAKGQNNGYKTHGVIVPLEYTIKHLVKQVIPIKGDL